MTLSWMDRTRFLLNRGTEQKLENEKISEENADNAIELLTTAAIKSPQFLLREITMSTTSALTAIALGILFAKANDDFLTQSDVKLATFELLLQRDPADLVDFVDILRSNSDGRRFGSRPQKILRRVMESWQDDVVEFNILNFQDELKTLVVLVHPRFNGYRGELIRLLLNDDI